MLNDNLYPSDSYSKLIHVNKYFKGMKYALLFCILVHNAVTCAWSHNPSYNTDMDTKIYTSRITPGLQKTICSEKAEGSNPANS